MKEYVCYKTDELLKYLGSSFKIINKKVEDIFSDWCTGNVDSEQVEKFYITNKDNIQKIKECNGLWKEVHIYLTDKTNITLYSDNVNSDDANLIRISENNFFSPSFKMQADYILSGSKLNKWLLYNGVSREQLNQITKKFCLYSTFIFKGVPEPLIKNGKIDGYYGSDLKLSEEEIDKVLEYIKDVEMRYKFEAIIKSFERIYE